MNGIIKINKLFMGDLEISKKVHERSIVIKIKAVEKLLDMISKSIGTIYNDTLGIRAQAKRIEAKAIAQAKGELLQKIIGSEKIEEVLLGQMLERITHLEARRQDNINKIVSKTVDCLPEDVSEEPVDQDWAVRFFNICQDVGDDEMQLIWARLLAGELEQPGSFGLKTLEILKNLQRHQAEYFIKACQLCFKADDETFVLLKVNDEDFSKYGLSHIELLQLRQVGLISESINTAVFIPPDGEYSWEYANTEVVVQTIENEFVKIPAIPLTIAGIELEQLVIPKQANEEYLKDCQDYLKKYNCQLDFDLST